MWETFEKNQAQGVTGLVMDVHTGAILAMASFPSFDAQQLRHHRPGPLHRPGGQPPVRARIGDEGLHHRRGAGRRRDRPADHGRGRQQPPDRRASGSRTPTATSVPYGHGQITAGDVLNLSNNVGAAKIGLLLGGSGCTRRSSASASARRPASTSPARRSGVVWNPDGPNATGDLTAAQNAFGQGLSVTAVQLVAGYAAIANGGTLVTPHVIAGWTGPDGVYHAADVPQGERIMREETAHDDAPAADRGRRRRDRAQPAVIPGYSIAGKTGTAEVAGPETKQVQVGTDADGKPIYECARTRRLPARLDRLLVHLDHAGLATALRDADPRSIGRSPGASTRWPRRRSASSATSRRRSSTTWPSRPTGSCSTGRRQMRLVDSPTPLQGAACHRRSASTTSWPPPAAASSGTTQRHLLRHRRGRLATTSSRAAASWRCAASESTAIVSPPRPCAPAPGPARRTPVELPGGHGRRRRAGRGRAHRAPGAGRWWRARVERSGGGHHRLHRQDARQGDRGRRPVAARSASCATRAT